MGYQKQEFDEESGELVNSEEPDADFLEDDFAEGDMELDVDFEESYDK